MAGKVLLVFLLLGYISLILGDNLAFPQTKLLEEILSANYDKRVLPHYNRSVPVPFSLKMEILNIGKLYEHQDILELSANLNMGWNDYRLRWDPSRYKGIDVIHIPVSELWQPDISLYNNAEVRMEMMNSLAIVFSTGRVYYVPKARIRTQCIVDMTRFPYDTQTCPIEFISYTYDTMRLNNTGDNSYTHALDMYTEHKQWTVRVKSAEIEVKGYDCCPEEYQIQRYTLELKRKTVYFTYVFVLPAVVLALLVPFQFLLPPDSRERLSIGTILLLSSILMIAILDNYLPENHSTIPYIAQYYCLTLVWVMLSMVTSVCVININNRGPRRTKVPTLVRQIFLNTLKKLVCYSEDLYFPLEEVDSVTMRSLDKQSILAPEERVKNEGSKLEQDVDEILRKLNTIVHRGAIIESSRDLRSEWYQVAVVVDRIMCFVFFIVFIIYTCSLLIH